MLRRDVHSENIDNKLGKNSFHIHCQEHRGKAVCRKNFTRPKLIEFLALCPAITIAMETSGDSYLMARKLVVLGYFPNLNHHNLSAHSLKATKNGFNFTLNMFDFWII